MESRATVIYALCLGVLMSGASGAIGAVVTDPPNSDPNLIPGEDVKKYYEVMRRMDDKVGDLFTKLVDRFGYKAGYTPAEVQWPIGVKKSKEDLIYATNPKREPPTPAGAISSEDAHRVLRVH